MGEKLNNDISDLNDNTTHIKINIEAEINIGDVTPIAIEKAIKQVEKMHQLVIMSAGAKLIKYFQKTEALTNNQLVEQSNLTKFYTVMKMGSYVSPEMMNITLGCISLGIKQQQQSTATNTPVSNTSSNDGTDN